MLVRSRASQAGSGALGPHILLPPPARPPPGPDLQLHLPGCLLGLLPAPCLPFLPPISEHRATRAQRAVGAVCPHSDRLCHLPLLGASPTPLVPWPQCWPPPVSIPTSHVFLFGVWAPRVAMSVPRAPGSEVVSAAEPHPPAGHWALCTVLLVAFPRTGPSWGMATAAGLWGLSTQPQPCCWAGFRRLVVGSGMLASRRPLCVWTGGTRGGSHTGGQNSDSLCSPRPWFLRSPWLRGCGRAGRPCEEWGG